MADDEREDDGTPVATDDPAPITTPPSRPFPSTKVATHARVKKAAQWFQGKVEEYKRLYPTLAQYGDSTKLMCEQLHISRQTLRKLQTATGMRLADARLAGRLAVEGQPVPVAKPPKSLKYLNASILKLFDSLMLQFREEDDDDTIPTEQDDADHRKTWTAWRVFLAAAFGESQLDLGSDLCADGISDAATRPVNRQMPPYPGVSDPTVPRGAGALAPGATSQEIFEACTGRKTWPTWQSRIIALIVGRRGGKSYVTAIIGIYLALCRKYTLNKGTRGMVMILARDREQAAVIRSYVVAFLMTDWLRPFLMSEPTQRLIELNNGITIEIRSVSDAGTRGYTVVAALMDEIAFWPTDEKSAKQDKKVLRALRPAMLGIKNALLVMLSSPYAMRGELYETWKRSYAKDDDHRYLVWQADTLSMRPSDDPDLLEEIRTEYEEDPENAKAEYGAQFRSDIQGIFHKKAVEACCIPGRVQLPCRSDRNYRGFVDPSGGSSDSYVLAIAHDESRQVGGIWQKVPVLDFVREWTAPFDPAQVSQEVAEACKVYGLTQVTGDAYGGEWPRDPLRKRGIVYELADKTRSELYLEFLPMINSGMCELLDADVHRRLVNQLSNLERRMGRTGKDTVDHPPGSHDDVANAVAGVMVEAHTVEFFTGIVWRT